MAARPIPEAARTTVLVELYRKVLRNDPVAIAEWQRLVAGIGPGTLQHIYRRARERVIS